MQYRILVFVAFLGLTWAMPTTRLETDPELTAGYVEGDMVLDMHSRNGLRNEVYKWPDSTVYYKFFTQFGKQERKKKGKIKGIWFNKLNIS